MNNLNLNTGDLYLKKITHQTVKKNPFVINRHSNNNLVNDTISFKGEKVSKQDIKGYQEKLDQYANLANLHNRILYSFGDPSSMAQVLADAQKRLGQTKNEIFEGVKDAMLGTFDSLKTSPIHVVEGTKITDFSLLDSKKFDRVKQIYNDLLTRPETFDRYKFDSKTQKLEEVVTKDAVAHQSESLKEIINEVLPDILNSKTFVTQDPANLYKVLNDEVIQDLILDKLYDKNPDVGHDDHDHHDHDNHDHGLVAKSSHGNHDHCGCGHDHGDKLVQIIPDLRHKEDTPKDKHDHSGHDHVEGEHDHHDHDHNAGKPSGHDHEHGESCDHDHDHSDHDHSGHDHNHSPEDKLQSAINLLEKINSKFSITTISKVPQKRFDPFGKIKDKFKTPDDYYSKKYKGLRQLPKNFLEAQYLRKYAKEKGVSDISEKDIIMVTPTDPAKDIITKLNFINKDFLYIEKWLYDFCLGDETQKKAQIEKLKEVSDPETHKDIDKIAKEIDNYINNYLKLYDIKSPENDVRLNNVVKDYNKALSMAELSKGYFLGVGEDATDLVKTFGLFLFIGEVGHHAAEGASSTFIGHIVNGLFNIMISCGDDIIDSSKNYLKWKNEYGDEKAKQMLRETIAFSISTSLPAGALNIESDGTMAEQFIFRQASAASTYMVVTKNIQEYSKKFEKLIEKGVVKIPDDIKDDPDKITEWKVHEVTKQFLAHGINRGSALGIMASLGYAPLPKVLYAFDQSGHTSAVVKALAGTLECIVSNAYVLFDKPLWNKYLNEYKTSLVENDIIDMTPDEFLEKRKGIMQKTFEKSFVSKTIAKSKNSSSWISEHTPEFIKKVFNKTADKTSKVAKVYYGAVDKYMASFVTNAVIKYLDWKYVHMSEEERKKAEEGSSCSCGGH